MMPVVQGQGPVVVHQWNLLDRSQNKAFRAEPGRSLRELQPVTTLPRMCFYNGDIVLPEDLDWVPSASDHVRFAVLPQGGGGGGSAAILGIIMIVAGIFIPGAQGLLLMVGGFAALATSLIPMPNMSALTDAQTPTPSPTYSTQLGGNSARLGGAIPVLYGRHLINPDFASQPYSEFANDAAYNQDYYALLSLGHLGASYDIEALQLDDTDLSHFIEVQTHLVGPGAGAAVTLVNPCVVNAVEVSGNDMKHGVYIGPFAACGPGLKSSVICIDIICPRGLYYANSDGSLGSKTITWLVEARKITDRGAVAGDWILLGNETLTAATNTQIRKTYRYATGADVLVGFFALPSTYPLGRYEVRVSRQDVEDTNTRAAHAIQWAAMRAYVVKPAPLEPQATFLEVKMRATSQLTGLSSRKLSAIVQRHLPTWHPDTGWSDPVVTNSIAWAFADVCRSTVYGAGLPDARIDLQTLYELDQVWAERGDTFNGIFDKRITVWAALTAIARAGRARPIMRFGVITVVRDGQQDLPVALFNMRNIVRGSFSIDYELVDEDSPDGLETSYFDEETWSTQYVRKPVPGVEESVNPANGTLMGVTNFAQAERETLYAVAAPVYRNAVVSFKTEMEGYLPSFGDLIAVAHDVVGWGISGDIEAWDDSTFTATATEDLTWTVGDHYCVLADQYGDLIGPFKVVSGSEPRSMIFVDAPDGLEIYTGTERERTRFSMGPANNYAKMCRVIKLVPSSDDQVSITAVVEDNRVHTADGWLPGTGGGTGRLARYAPDGTPVYDAATEVQHSSYGFFSNVDNTVGAAGDEGYTYGA